MLFGEVNVLNRAMNLAYFEMLGNAADVNNELDKFRAVSVEQMQRVANEIFREEVCNTLRYFSENKI